MNIILRNSPNAAFIDKVADFVRKFVLERQGGEARDVKICVVRRYKTSEMKQYEEALASTQDCSVRLFDNLLSFSEVEGGGRNSQTADIERKYIRGYLVPCYVSKNYVLDKVAKTFEFEGEDFDDVGGFIIEIAVFGGKMTKKQERQRALVRKFTN